MSLACGGRAAAPAHDTHTRARRDRERRIHSGAAAAPVYIGEARLVRTLKRGSRLARARGPGPTRASGGAHASARGTRGADLKQASGRCCQRGRASPVA
eukprot:scaffold40209_cov49-Phaeocystis_antarctica.AAC.1